MDTDSIYETVTLPNGGVVQLDKLAFEAFKGQCLFLSCKIMVENNTL